MAFGARRGLGRRRAAVLAVVIGLGSVAAPASAVHFYRGPGGGCSPADGMLAAEGADVETSADATVLVLHNTFNDTANGSPVTRIAVGDTVQWDWSSEHCHSVSASASSFYSGYHYPSAEPTTPALAPGLFHYPVPTSEATLMYRKTFTEPGTYQYVCEHHAAIGMVGTVIVE